MIDLHTHSLLSDGCLLPSELARRAEAKGLEAIAITDHVDFSNIDFVIPRIIKACKALTKYLNIKVVPGVEITHVPPRAINKLVSFARKQGVKIVIGHGETISEPVMAGTNKAFIKARVDVLAHPGMISEEDIKLAKKNGIFLEITTRKSHGKTNKRLLKLASKYGAKLVLNTDSHVPSDIMEPGKRKRFLTSLGIGKTGAAEMIKNARALIKKSA